MVAKTRFCSMSCTRRFRGENFLERSMRKALDKLGIAYAQEVQIGRYVADFVVPQFECLIEVDGDYWHNAAKDARRDEKMLEHGWKTVRFKEWEIRRHVAELPELVSNRLGLDS